MYALRKYANIQTIENKHNLYCFVDPCLSFCLVPSFLFVLRLLIISFGIFKLCLFYGYWLSPFGIFKLCLQALWCLFRSFKNTNVEVYTTENMIHFFFVNDAKIFSPFLYNFEIKSHSCEFNVRVLLKNLALVLC